MLQGQPVPEHNTIARFRTERLRNCIEDLFNQLIIKLEEYNEIQCKTLFIDGTKIEANANRYTFVWKKATDKFEAKLQEKIKKLIPKITSDFKINFDFKDEKISVDNIKKVLLELNKIKDSENVKFVSGKGKRKSILQKYVEALDDFSEKQSKYDSYNNIFDGRNSFSKTDKDATFMRMKEDHMKNGQLKPAYNVQIGVEGEYIVGVDISNERSDQLTFIPFLYKINKNSPRKFQDIVADSGYESEENYEFLSKTNQQAYIKPQTYEKSKAKKFKKDISKRGNMYYDVENNFYICAYGKKLRSVNSKIRKSKSGFQSLITVYECEDCSTCPYKSKCTKAKGNRQLHVSKNFIEKRTRSLKNITTEKGKLLRMNRSIQVEGAFGYNINKLYNKTRQNRNQINLHKMKVS